jgi:methionyl-tRNA synthetase
MERFETHEALAAIWDVVDLANKYVVTVEPWVLAKTRATGGAEGEAAAERLRTCLYYLAEALRRTGVMAGPFLPSSSQRLLLQLGIEEVGVWPETAAWGGSKPGTRVSPADVLFPRIEIGEPDER